MAEGALSNTIPPGERVLCRSLGRSMTASSLHVSSVGERKVEEQRGLINGH
jgi:hypothetical protein